MKFTYEPGQGEDDLTTAFGKVFEAGKPVEITDEKMAAKLKGNPSFRYAGKKDEADSGPKDDETVSKAIDGRSKAAREARAKADEAVGEAEAKERAEATVKALAEAREAQAKGL